MKKAAFYFICVTYLSYFCYAKPRALVTNFTTCDALVIQSTETIAKEHNQGQTPNKVIFVKQNPFFHKPVPRSDIVESGYPFRDVTYGLMYIAIVHTNADGRDVCNEIWFRFDSIDFKNNTCKISERIVEFKMEPNDPEYCDLESEN